jgi:hypothetical protein
MKPIYRKLCEVAVLGALLLVITSPVTKAVWAQLVVTLSPSAHVSVSNAGTTQLIGPNNTRKYLMFQNLDSTNAVEYSTTSPVGSTYFVLPANGGLYAPTVGVRNSWYAIGLSTAASTVAVQEGN